MKHLAAFFFTLLTLAASAQVVSTYSGQAGTAGVNQSSTTTFSAARYNSPSSLLFDANGKIWILERDGNRLRLIDSPAVYVRAGSLSSDPGSHNAGGAQALFNFPGSMVMNSSGEVFISDENNQCIRKVSAYVNVSTQQQVTDFAGLNTAIAGFADGTGSAARFNTPKGMAIDSANNIYLADAGNNCIRKITAAGVVTTLTGDTSGGYADGSLVSAKFRYPVAVQWYNSTQLLVADQGNKCIRKIDLSTGQVTTVAGDGLNQADDGDVSTASFLAPTGIAVDASKNIYVTDGFPAHTVRKIAGTCVSTFAGTATLSGTTNGSGSVARFNNPAGICFHNNALYVCDLDNHTIRKITVSPTAPASGPVAVINAPVRSGTTTTVFNFYDSSSTGTSLKSHLWRFTPNTVTWISGTDSTSANPRVMFNQGASYTVFLRSQNCYGFDSVSQSGYITIAGGVAPIANFSVSGTTGNTATNFKFYDSSLNNPVNWAWAFDPNFMFYNNNTDSTSQNPEVGFLVFGTYSVTLIVSNARGSDTLKKTNYITVGNTGIAEATAAEAFGVSPNPGSGNFAVDLASMRNATLTVYDLSGKLLLEQQQQQQATEILDLRSFKPGLYFLNVRSEKGSATRKLIIE